MSRQSAMSPSRDSGSGAPGADVRDAKVRGDGVRRDGALGDGVRSDGALGDGVSRDGVRRAESRSALFIATEPR
ncbi:hypothetical protein LY13_001022 [Prauserella aidingensis]|nr:hypothetical protein [Prauserella aidingensis]